MRLNEEIIESIKQYEASQKVILDKEKNLLIEAIDVEEIYAVRWFNN
nr:hypothetical protein [uncultured Niameybacter sp.]